MREKDDPQAARDGRGQCVVRPKLRSSRRDAEAGSRLACGGRHGLDSEIFSCMVSNTLLS